MMTMAEIALQRIAEHRILTTTALTGYAALGGICNVFGKHDKAWTMLAQVHRTTRSATLRRTVEGYLAKNVHAAWGDRGAPVAQLDSLLGVRILVIKPKISEREKGVVLVKFSETIRDFARTFDLSALLQDYHLVLEPSWSGYCDPDLLCYTKHEGPIFVMAAEEDDYRLLSDLGSNLVPLRMGPSDWVDPELGALHLDRPKQYDIVFNSNWKRIKRHYVLFSALSRIPRKLRVALIGGAVDMRSVDDIRRLAMHYGVLDQLTFFEHIPYTEVMRIHCESRIAVLLSLKEGSNRAIAEAMFCDVPGLILEEHVGGIRKNVVPETGRIVRERHLAEEIVNLLNNLESFSPRTWALQNISCYASSARLNDVIRSRSAVAGEEWTRDIAVKANVPELRLVVDAERAALANEHRRLLAYAR